MDQPGDIASEQYQRRIILRPDVGATATVRQVSGKRISSLLVQAPSLIVVERGIKTVSSVTGEVHANPGEAVFLPEGRYDVINQPDLRGAYEAYWLGWTASSLERYRTVTDTKPSDGAVRIADISPEMTEALRRAHLSIVDELLPDSIALHRLEEVLAWLVHHGVKIDRRPDPSLPGRVSALIASDPSRAWTLEAVAKCLVISQATLRRSLSDGGSFTEILIDARMSAALSLLQSTDLPIDRIALDVGYASPSRFSVRFRKRFGFAPSAIRGHRRST